MNIARLAWALISRLSFHGHHRCNICNHRIGRFLPYRGGWESAPALMRALDVVGSDLDHHECPWCGAHDRERHVLMYMRATGLWDAISGMAILHFAPERRLSKHIRAAQPVRYIRCDLHPGESDMERIDMLDIPYPDWSFDLVIANHVLEHVSDDERALREVRRVLKPGGRAILQTPYSQRLHRTWSDDGIDEGNARLQAYGQEDHVRLFGKDIFHRIASVGFTPMTGYHKDLLPGQDAEIFGVNVREPFFLFERTN